MNEFRTTYLGHTPEYWLELDAMLMREPECAKRMVEDNAKLRAKVSFYEDCIDSMKVLRIRINDLGREK